MDDASTTAASTRVTPDPTVDAMGPVDTGDALRFEMVFDGRMVLAALPFGIRPSTAHVDVDHLGLTAHFGPWTVRTPRANVASAEITGPYRPWDVVGPPHVSLRHRGLTFATTTARGVRIRFHHPIRGIDPLGLVRHPELTVTVADPEGLVAALTGSTELDETEQVLVDKLHGMSAAQLRALAVDQGVDGASGMSKAELVTALEQLYGDRLDEVLETDEDEA